MKKRTNKKKRIVYILLIVLLAISVGYAVVMSNLKLIGFTTVSKKNWGIHFDNVQLKEGSSPNTEPDIGEESEDPEDTLLTFSPVLNDIDAFYEFTVDIVNESEVDVMLTGLTKTATPTLPSYIKFDVTYEDGVEIANNHIIKKAVDSETPTIETLKVSVRFDKNSMTLEDINAMTTDKTFNFSVGLTYEKATSAGVERDRHITSCPNCVFAYTEDYVEYTPGATFELSDYKTSYTKLTYFKSSSYDDYDCDEDSYGCDLNNPLQYPAFMGFRLKDNNTKVDQGYMCAMASNKPFCLELSTSTDEEKLTRNKQVLSEVLDLDYYCNEDDYYGVNEFTCTKIYDDDSYLHIEMHDGGYIRIESKPADGNCHECYSSSDGSIDCGSNSSCWYYYNYYN